MTTSREEAEKRAEQFFKHDYHDRGMLKWAGYFLSDHTSALKQNKKDEAPEKLLAPQPLNEVSRLLADAWQHHLNVHLQLNQLQESEIIESITGMVIGFYDNTIGIQVSDEKINNIELDEIRNVTLLND
ncbi:hypothetical protein [Paucilactobacillus kaifaensis]|uniref:hypothetical protein n=1 Tax=Paucilactobacillus kaifaensis TaxID=2559921 RepID=UPI0010F954C8|nr:hypothetical protein [Paucilactobacillus kaifaensis]